MNLVLLGDAEDARGFQLAGVDSRVCRTRDDVERAVGQVLERGPESVVLVLECVYRLAPAVFDALEDRPRWPIVVVLPEPEPETRSSV